MKKMLACVIAILVLVFAGCGKKEQRRLEGYYKANFVGAEQFKFEITDLGGGDYGGEMTNMDRANSVHSWYVLGNEVYVNGELAYLFLDDYLVQITKKTDLKISGDNCISGKYRFIHIPLYDVSTSDQFEFREDGAVTETAYRGSRETRRWESTYTVSENVITVSNEKGDRKLFIIYNNEIYPILERI